MNLERAWRVLLIDDSEIALEVQAATLTRAGFEVRSATNVEVFDQQLESWAPDLILTDVNMPGMTGVELCRLLKGRYDTAHVPIILCSSRTEEELEELARQCEADGYLSKSGGMKTLADEVRMLCESVAW